MIKKATSILLLLSAAICYIHAQQAIALEDIWDKGTFRIKTVPGFNFLKDGKHYSRQEDRKIRQYDLATGQPVKDLFDAASVRATGFDGTFSGYGFSPAEDKILLETDAQPVYRRSKLASYFVWDTRTGMLQPLFDKGKQRDPTFSPQGDKIAFCHENDLYVKNLQTGKVTRITKDGQKNSIINGTTDWVYEEEFEFTRFYAWSPDGEKIAWVRSDESKVPEFTMTHFRNGLYPEYETFKYPKVGENNSVVTAFIYHLKGNKRVAVQMGGNNEYIPRILWTKDPDKLCVYKMNRHQNDLELLAADARTGKTTLLLRETNPCYIEIHDNLTFLEDGRHFVWTSEQDGFNHLYLHDMQSGGVTRITRGEWEVTAFYGADEKRGLLYYQSTEESPLERYVYAVDLKGGNKRRLTPAKGTNEAQFSSSFDYFVNVHSTINSPADYAVCDREGKILRVIEDNATVKKTLENYGVQPAEFFRFTTGEGVALNGWMIRPAKMEPNRKYPVFMFLYGGPGSQQVLDSWRGSNFLWFQMLAQQGYIVACVDNRGTGGRGEAFKKKTYLELGKYETRDQIEAARYLGSLPFADSTRIGIFGWSYGGFMSTSCLFKGNGVFKMAIAVAPVTSWRWYDNIYTERYMRTEKENPKGYADNSPVNFAGNLKGSYLLVHGMGDDNVHFQNAAELVNALVGANKQFESAYYPNRNHGISGGKTRLHLYTKMTDFIRAKL